MMITYQYIFLKVILEKIEMMVFKFFKDQENLKNDDIILLSKQNF